MYECSNSINILYNVLLNTVIHPVGKIAKKKKTV